MLNFTIKRVITVGGVHGNELTGVYLIKKFEEYPNFIYRPSFETLTLLANLKAITVGKRYIDIDLNRCFKPQDLQDKNLVKYEQSRAKQIARYIQQKKIDFIIDLHSSTAKMGLTVILNNNHPFLLQLAAYLSVINPSVRILQYSSNNQTSPYLRSLCELGLAIEVGPIFQGVLNAELFQQTETLLGKILDYVELYNQGKALYTPKTFSLYKQVATVDYPRDKYKGIKAMIAPKLNDYQALNPGSPMFLGFDGQVLTYQGNSIVYPVFLGEAAYVEKGIAMGLTKQIKVEA